MPDQLAWPIRIDHTGRLATVDRDSHDGIAQAVKLTLATGTGERVVSDSYGVPDPSHAGVSEQDIRQAVSRWVPRAAITITIDPPDGTGRQAARITVERR